MGIGPWPMDQLLVVVGRLCADVLFWLAAFPWIATVRAGPLMNTCSQK